MSQCEKYGVTGLTTAYNIIRGMRFDHWTNTSTNTHPECVVPIAFPRSNGHENPPQYYVHCLSRIHLSLLNSC